MKIKHKDLDIHPKKSVKSKNFKKHRKQGIAVQTTLNKLTNKTPLEPEPSSPIKNSPKDDFGDLFLVFGDNDPPISKHEADGKEGITVQKTPNRLTNKAPLEPEPSSPKKYSSQDDFGDHFDPSKSKHDGVTVQPEDDEDRYSEFDEDNDKSLLGEDFPFFNIRILPLHHKVRIPDFSPPDLSPDLSPSDLSPPTKKYIPEGYKKGDRIFCLHDHNECVAEQLGYRDGSRISRRHFKYFDDDYLKKVPLSPKDSSKYWDSDYYGTPSGSPRDFIIPQETSSDADSCNKIDDQVDSTP